MKSGRRWRLQVWLVLGLGVFGAAPVVRATDVIAPTVPAEIVPARGATHVATDSAVWLLPKLVGREPVYRAASPEGAFELQDAAGDVVPTTFLTIRAGGEADSVQSWRAIHLLRPDAPLAPGESYTLVEKPERSSRADAAHTFTVVDRAARGDIQLYAQLAPDAPVLAAWQTVEDLQGSSDVLGFLPAEPWSDEANDVRVLTFDAAGAVLGEKTLSVRANASEWARGGRDLFACTQVRGTWFAGMMAALWLLSARRKREA